jgi:hypothetical protein
VASGPTAKPLIQVDVSVSVDTPLLNGGLNANVSVGGQGGLLGLGGVVVPIPLLWRRRRDGKVSERRRRGTGQA